MNFYTHVPITSNNSVKTNFQGSQSTVTVTKKASETEYQNAIKQYDKLMECQTAEEITSIIKQIADTLPVFRGRADQNDPDACFRLGKLYGHLYLIKGERSFTRSSELLLKAKELNHPEAEKAYLPLLEHYVLAGHNPEAADPAIACKIGIKYYDGDGVDVDKQKAIPFFKLASELGNATASEKLADIYLQGDGVEKSSNEAMCFLESAKQQGSSTAPAKLNTLRLEELHERANTATTDEGKRQANFVIGVSHAEGKLGLTKNIAAALPFFITSSKQGSPDASAKLAELYFTGNAEAKIEKSLLSAIEYFDLAVTQEMNTGQLPSSKLKALETAILANATEPSPEGNAETYYEMSINYAEGKNNRPKDQTTADAFLKLASKLGSSVASEKLGQQYIKQADAQYNNRNFDLAATPCDEAITYLTLAGNQGSTTAADKLNKPRYMKLDIGQKLNDVESTYKIAQAHIHGTLGCAVDLKKAVFFLEDAYRLGHKQAAYQLSKTYKNLSDTQRSEEWLKKAVEQGNRHAQYELAIQYFNGGNGVKKDRDQAIQLLQKTLDQIETDPNATKEEKAKVRCYLGVALMEKIPALLRSAWNNDFKVALSLIRVAYTEAPSNEKIKEAYDIYAAKFYKSPSQSNSSFYRDPYHSNSSKGNIQ